MKMVKSLLLGSAAGVVAVAGAQAADLPVKAKPVQYVKICTLYGDGFYYIPGSDTCIRFSGYIRADYDYNGRAPHVQYRVPPVRRTAPSATTRPGTAATSRRHAHADCLRHAADVYETSTARTSTARTTPRHSPCVHPVGWLHLRPDGVVHRPRRQPRRLRHALAVHQTQSTARPAPTASTRSPIPGSSATASP